MSKIEVNEVDKQTGSTLTIGGSGTTVQLGTGASQTGFGRTGTVNWQTTIKTGNFSASDGEGYFVNTTSGAITASLPAGTAGAIVAFKDYLNTWDTNALTLSPNGSDKIGGAAADSVLNTESQSVTLIFTDSVRGWVDIHDSTSDVVGTKFVAATGGTETIVCTNFKVHTFTGPGTFCVSCAGNPGGSDTVSYLVVGGGGSSAPFSSGGGGAGGFRESRASTCSYTASPLNATVGPTYNLSVTATGFPITVGAAGAPSPAANNAPARSGSASSFSTISSAGGGGGGTGPNSEPTPTRAGGSGGSGGGGATADGPGANPGVGGSGNTPPVSPSQGNDGGGGRHVSGVQQAGGGGGGATAGGTNSTTPAGGAGGAGATTSISGTPTAYAGGGGGGIHSTGTGGAGGTGGGGTGASAGGGNPGMTGGTANRGGGAGGQGCGGGTSNGGSGIVIIRYKFQ